MGLSSSARQSQQVSPAREYNVGKPAGALGKWREASTIPHPAGDGTGRFAMGQSLRGPELQMGRIQPCRDIVPDLVPRIYIDQKSGEGNSDRRC